MLTANTNIVLQELKNGAIENIHNNDRIQKKEYLIDGKKVYVANWGPDMFSAIDLYEQLAKGIVYDEDFNLLAMPYVKFYNSFEGIAVEDAKDFINLDSRIVKKYDGTLIARWVYNGKVYFNTRGVLISATENEFYQLTMQVIKERGYDWLLNPKYLPNHTLIMELVGKDNMILEYYDENDLFITGVYSHKENKYSDPYEFNFYPVKIAATYNGSDPKEVLEGLEGVQEGIIVEYLKGNEVLYRVKYKQEAYLSLLKAKNEVSKENLLEIVAKNNIGSLEELEILLMKHYPKVTQYLEEVMQFYTVWFDEVQHIVDDFRHNAAKIDWVADEIRDLPTRKEQFFKAKELLGSEGLAGIAMGYLNGKFDFNQTVELFYKNYLKGLK